MFSDCPAYLGGEDFFAFTTFCPRSEKVIFVLKFVLDYAIKGVALRYILYSNLPPQSVLT